MEYLADIYRYEGGRKLPLWVEHVPYGRHNCRLFHRHLFSEIVIVARGPGVHLWNNTACPIYAGDVLVVHPGHRHAYDDTARLEIVNLLYDRDKVPLPLADGLSLPLFRHFFPQGDNPDDSAEPVVRLSGAQLREALRKAQRLREELRSGRPGGLCLGVALFLEILVLLARCSGEADPARRLRSSCSEAMAYLHRNFARPVAMEELAAAAHLSRRSLFRHFKAAAGCTPVEYLQRLRVQRAAELLLRTDLTLMEIAGECGFCDSNYFCRVFRRIMRQSPGRFRASQAE